MEIILGKERRRWSEADKLRIVAETFEAEVTCLDVARRHQPSTGMLFTWHTWRKRLRAEAGFPEPGSKQTVDSAQASYKSLMQLALGPEEGSMKRTWTIIGVADVARSFDWYQSLFGQPKSVPAHDYFGQILDTDGTVLLCLHKWGAHEHPTLTSPDRAEPGNGLILFFRVDGFDQALSRARDLVNELEEEPKTNPATGTHEFALRDPDGYYVMVSALA